MPYLIDDCFWPLTDNGAYPVILNNQAVSSETTLFTPTTGQLFRLMGMIISGDQAGAYIFKDDTGGQVCFEVYLPANGNPAQIDLRNGIISNGINHKLTVTGPGSSHLTGTIFVINEAPGISNPNLSNIE
jgi:hypothetical protein